jgi:cell division septal protein FtsQ
LSAAAVLALRRSGVSGAARPLAACLLAVLALAGGYLLWFRDLPLFAVDEVRIEGVAPGLPGEDELRAALTREARGMTTLHVEVGRLREAAGRFPAVASVSAEADFPSGLRIFVEERRPAAVIGEGEDAVAVASDGVLLPGLATEGLDLPRLPLSRAPARDRLTGPALEQALVLGAAPKALSPLLAGVRREGSAITVELDVGIELRFGKPVRVEEKWRAAAAVFADPELTALDYVDLTVPGRPAVGGAGHTLPAVG